MVIFLIIPPNNLPDPFIEQFYYDDNMQHQAFQNDTHRPDKLMPSNVSETNDNSAGKELTSITDIDN
jgi:hypothetical protein